MRNPTVFDKIISGQIPSTKVYESDSVLAIKDIHPLAPTHLLFITKRERDYLSSITDITDATAHVPSLLLQAARDFAKEKGIESYKLCFHCGPAVAQVQDFLHLHLLSEERLKI